MIDTVLFDLDGTLVDYGPAWRQSVTDTVGAVCARHSGIDSEHLREAYYAVADLVWEEIRNVEAAPWGNMDDEATVDRVWRATLSKVGISDRDTLREAVRTYLRPSSFGAHTFEDAKGCLDRLAPTYKLGIVTNGAACQQVPKLEGSNLASYFEVVTTTDVGFGKPQPDIFMHALEALSAVPAAAAYVGDSIDWDVGGANRAGMISVWLNRKSADRKPQDPTPDMEITSLAELPDLLLKSLLDSE